MPRSGSTLIFNALRLLLESDPDCKLQSAWVREARDLPRANTYLIKTHGMNVIDAWRASKIIYSYRDPRVALVSLCRKFDVQPTAEFIRNWLRDFAFAEERADLLIRYELMITDLSAIVSALADVVGIKTDTEQLVTKLTEVMGPGITADKKTLLHDNHVTGTRDDDWRAFFSEDMKEEIAREFGPWLERHGYEAV